MSFLSKMHDEISYEVKFINGDKITINRLNDFIVSDDKILVGVYGRDRKNIQINMENVLYVVRKYA